MFPKNLQRPKRLLAQACEPCCKTGWLQWVAICIYAAAISQSLIMSDVIAQEPSEPLNASAPSEPAGASAASGEASEDLVTEEGRKYFLERVEPIFQKHCYGCHSHAASKSKGGLVLDSKAGWVKGGSDGTSVVPFKPEESLLIAAVRYDGYEMPPEKPLLSEDIAILEEWVRMGAPDPRQADPGIRDPGMSGHRESDPSALWALEPIKETSVPSASQLPSSDWCHDPIDAFLLSRLVSEGLGPARDTDRASWLRRVSIDLTGLPPTLEEFNTYSKDDSIEADERLVDRLLSSPSFAEHWGRHWLDLACYADLADIQGDVLIRDAWRYRDYVIDSLRADKPMDRFIHEQIAGDLLPYESVEQRREQLIATGFLAIGPWTLQNYIKKQLDADVVDHQIDKIGKVFLGQTIACARCHDHKFDPIPTADYYALAGIFHSTRTTSYDGPGVWSQISHVSLPTDPRSESEYKKLEESLSVRKSELLRQLTEQESAESIERYGRYVRDDQANGITLREGISANEVGVRYHVSWQAGPSVWSDASQATQAEDGLLVQVLRSDDTVLAYYAASPGAWNAGARGVAFAPMAFGYTGDGTGPVRLHVTSNRSTGRFGGVIDRLQVHRDSESPPVFVDNFDDTQRGELRGKQANTGKTVLAKCILKRWDGMGVNHSHALEVDEQDIAIQFYSAGPSPKGGPVAMKLRQEIATIDQTLQSRRPDGHQAIAVRDIESPKDGPIYKRGEFASLGPIVPRGFLRAVPVSSKASVAENQSGRLELAHWLTDSENPLTSRVLVNRIWKELFGQGLVRTVDYFGVHGERPTHPELLDFLAKQFRDVDHWSLKQTIRRMVLTRAYRMSSISVESRREDPENRLVSRMPRRRMTAESIRDTMLLLSGELDFARSGPSLGLHIDGNINGLGGNVNPATWGGKLDPVVRNRRTVYLPLKRERPSGELELLSVFDFPHPNDITGQRPNTTVPTQALFLMNAPTLKERAQQMAKYWLSEDYGSQEQRVSAVLQAAWGRPPEASEIEWTMQFMKGFEESYKESYGVEGGPEIGKEAWVQFCHSILSSNGFLFYE